MLKIACCLVVALGLGLGLRTDLVSGWYVVMHTYLCDFGLYCHGPAVTMQTSDSAVTVPQILTTFQKRVGLLTVRLSLCGFTSAA